MSIFGLNLSTTDLWLLGVCGTLVMAWVGFLLASTLNKRSRHNQAADLFRSKILSELEGFYPPFIPEPKPITARSKKRSREWSGSLLSSAIVWEALQNENLTKQQEITANTAKA